MGSRSVALRRTRRRLARRLNTPRLRTAWATLAVVLALALVGAAAGPRWNPEPVTASLTPSSESVAVAGSTGSSVVGTYETTSQIVQVDLGGEGESGPMTDVLIVEPVGLTEPAPAVVFLHGAGTGLSAAFSEHAQALASAGIVAVAPSKRLDNYSTLQRDYVAMAADYSHTLALARSLPGVDPDRVGLYAESEGAWVAPVLAADNPDVAFLALVSAPVVTPRQQGAFAVDAYLRAVGVPQTFLRAIPRATGAHWPAGFLTYADFDVRPYLERTPQQIFMAYGTADLSMPTVQGPQIVVGAVPRGDEQVLLRYYEGANHGIRIGTATDPVVPQFLDGLATWMLDPERAVQEGPAVAGATPRQVHLASAVPPPRWYADGEMMLRVPLTSAAVGGVGFLLLAGVGLLGLLRRRPAAEPVEVAAVPGPVVPGPGVPDLGAPDRETDGPEAEEVDPDDEVYDERAHVVRGLLAFTAATLAVVLALVCYIAAVAQLALSYSTNGVVVWGGWVLLQAAAVIAAWLGVRAARRLVAQRPGREPRALVRVVAAWLVVGGALGLLVTTAYWGAFSPLS